MQKCIFFHRRIYDKLLHVSDWFPTILNLAGVTENFQNLDGVDQFQSLFEDKIDSPGRKMVVNEVDDGYFWGNRGAFQIEGGWKFVKNPVIFSLRSETYLYNVNDDPSETTDLKSVYPDILQSMEAQFEVNFCLHFAARTDFNAYFAGTFENYGSR